MGPDKDPQLDVAKYQRTQEHDEVLGFETNCPECNAPVSTNMKLTKIPNFKEVVIMATNCEACGHKTNEVKSGSGIEPKGMCIKLKIDNLKDLTRDVLKSDTCTFSIPELDFESGAASLGGKFTTVEGLLTKTAENLLYNNPMVTGDSADKSQKEKIETFIGKLEEIRSGDRKVTMVLDDPAGNSYVQNLYEPEPDVQLQISHYERSFEQNEELGLNDMKVENYN